MYERRTTVLVVSVSEKKGHCMRRNLHERTHYDERDTITLIAA